MPYLFNMVFTTPVNKDTQEIQPDAVTVKPVCNDHLYNKIYYLWFIQ